MLHKCKHTYFLRAFLFLLLIILISKDICNKTIIPLVLVGYEMVIANLVLIVPCWLSMISYPMRTCGIFVNYPGMFGHLLSLFEK